MLIRFVVKNLYSFGEMKEFNMIPGNKFKRLAEHKYKIGNFEVLKLASIYGANAAGKSNLIKSLLALQEIIIFEELPVGLNGNKFKFSSSEKDAPIVLEVEFFQEAKFFYYALEIGDKFILTEELYESKLGKKDDVLIFERKTSQDGKTTLKFLEEFESDKESRVLKNVIEKNLVKPDKPILKLLTTLDNPFLNDTRAAFSWFEDNLQIIKPGSRPVGLAHRIEVDKDFYKYAKEIMCSFHVGINDIKTQSTNIKEYFGENEKEYIEELNKEIEQSPNKMISLPGNNNEEILIGKRENEIFVKRLEFEHQVKNNISAHFSVGDESDGTIRLLDFIPAFNDIVSSKKVYVIDEIERSIHPLLVKELVRKFSEDKKSNGQLIFCTHESNLLDQEIFRQDEIWFAEKDKNGCTDLYSLSDFKEHSTIDIRKGYLNGRYGSIPFLGNLKDLNWHKYASEK